jgi:hypothetical protein
LGFNLIVQIPGMPQHYAYSSLPKDHAKDNTICAEKWKGDIEERQPKKGTRGSR